MLMPLGMTILTRAAGPDRVGRVMAVLGIPMLLGPIFGPILGGWMIDAPQLALDLPDQPADRRRSPSSTPGSCCPGTTSSRRSPSTWSACCCSRPGLAAFLYGVSSIPEAGTINDPKVLTWAVVGLAADRRVRAVGAAPAQHPPAGRAAAAEEQEHDRRGDRDDAVRDRVLRGQPAVPAVLPAGARRDRAPGRPAAGAPGHRRDADDAGRRHAGRQDRPRQDRDGRHRRDHRRDGDVHPDRGRHRLPLPHRRAVHHGPRAWAPR